MHQENNAEQWECLCWKFRNGAGVPECGQGISCCRNRRWLSQSSLSPITTNHSPHRYRYQILSFSVPIGFFRKGATSAGELRKHQGSTGLMCGWRSDGDESVSVWALCCGRSKEQTLMSTSENSKVCSERTRRTNLTGGSRQHNENIEWPLPSMPSELSINMNLPASSAFSFIKMKK